MVRFEKPLSESLDAIYIKRNLLVWELAIDSKGKKVGINQGRFLLHSAKDRSAEVGSGKRTIL